MNRIRIEQQIGALVKAEVDSFYKKNGSQGSARNDDLFFIAYDGFRIVGCVRFCIEENTPMLRTMFVEADYQKQGIGTLLLLRFETYVEENNFKNVFCLPYDHLEKFYGQIKFQIALKDDAPGFLIERAERYLKNGTRTLLMRRA